MIQPCSLFALRLACTMPRPFTLVFYPVEVGFLQSDAYLQQCLFWAKQLNSQSHLVPSLPSGSLFPLYTSFFLSACPLATQYFPLLIQHWHFLAASRLPVK